MPSLENVTEDEKKVMEELKRRTIDDLTPKMREDESLFYRFCKAIAAAGSRTETVGMLLPFAAGRLPAAAYSARGTAMTKSKFRAGPFGKGNRACLL
ncbi:hypothetical protein NPIL_432421 [Nephila pilipes]|uniref:Uncharacterized protein n=1 Tax=Nephila pilipes TaxID=299642 RepID=A0A8X6N5X4_NEPPI|nr:hypothetical protein NPIL_432421 [Nephila pilipes]